MRSLLLALVLTAPAMASSGQPMEFKSAGEAALYALQEAADLSPYYEYAGVILRSPTGSYVFTDPETMYRGDQSSFDDDPADNPDGYTMVAWYHTHPCLPISHVPGKFSETDLQSSRSARSEAYMADLCTGNVHAWMPGVDVDPYLEQPVILQRLAPALTAGRLFGHINVTGTPLEHKP